MALLHVTRLSAKIRNGEPMHSDLNSLKQHVKRKQLHTFETFAYHFKDFISSSHSLYMRIVYITTPVLQLRRT